MRPRRSSCPISFGLDLFGDRWTLLILRDIVMFDVHRFSDFARAERIASNILSDRLHRLEEAGVVTRRVDPGQANQVLYEATEKGRALTPVLAELVLWGIAYDSETPVSSGFIGGAARDHDAASRQIRSAVDEGRFVEFLVHDMGVTDD